MAELRIAKSMENNFEVMISLEKEKIKKLFELLKSTEAGLTPHKVAERFYESIGIPLGELEKVVYVIYSVNRLKMTSEHSVEMIIDDFVSALMKTGNKKFTNEKCKEYLSEILSENDAVFLTIATSELVGEREKILRDVNILTDIRPLFDKDKFKGLTLIHTLKLEIESNNDDKSQIYLAMDKSDMDKLEKLIQQARAREEVLRSNISGSFVELS